MQLALIALQIEKKADNCNVLNHHANVLFVCLVLCSTIVHVYQMYIRYCVE